MHGIAAKRSNSETLACITLDIEPDYTQVAGAERHYGLFDTAGQFERFAGLLARHGVKLTCFVVGYALHDRPDYVRELHQMGAEFNPHSLTHDLTAQGSEREVRGSIQAFADFFGHRPEGYRSAQGRVSRTMLEMLEEEGIKYDSSVMPSLRPGVYSNLDKPTSPFRWQGLSLVELPMGALPHVRIPTALSYIKILGRGPFHAIQKFTGHPRPLVFLLHPMDLIYHPEAYAGLSSSLRLGYGRNRGRSWEILEWYLGKLREAGYRFAHLNELYRQVDGLVLPEVSPWRAAESAPGWG